MGVPAETDLGKLVGEVVRRVVRVEDVTPVFRRVERGVNYRRVGAGNGRTVRHAHQPGAFLFGELLPRPVHGELRMRIEAGHFRIAICRVFVVVATHHGRPVEIADQVEAFARFGVVADDVAERDVTVNRKFAAFLQNHFQCIPVGMNVTENRIFRHLCPKSRSVSGAAVLPVTRT